MNPFVVAGAVFGTFALLDTRDADLTGLAGGQIAALNALPSSWPRNSTSVYNRVANVPHDDIEQVGDVLSALISAARAGQNASSQPYRSGTSGGGSGSGPFGISLGSDNTSSLDDRISEANTALISSNDVDKSWDAAQNLARSMDAAGAAAALIDKLDLRDPVWATIQDAGAFLISLPGKFSGWISDKVWGLLPDWSKILLVVVGIGAGYYVFTHPEIVAKLAAFV